MSWSKNAGAVTATRVTSWNYVVRLESPNALDVYAHVVNAMQSVIPVTLHQHPLHIRTIAMYNLGVNSPL
jgi:hypothetical protein